MFPNIYLVTNERTPLLPENGKRMDDNVQIKMGKIFNNQ
jgi:hypothetical protein